MNLPTDPPSQDSGPPDRPGTPGPGGSAPAASTPGAQAPRALVIDDESSIRLALRRFLTRDGWFVDEGFDGRSGLEKLIPPSGPAPAYDIVICDLRMPGLGGVELHEYLRRARPELLDRFIVATGDAVSAEAAEFVQRTACPVLQKPFDLADLRALVRRVSGIGSGGERSGTAP